VRVNRDTRIQTERRDRLLMHLFQHQIHHRGQAHAMLSATAVRPPQLDEFFRSQRPPLGPSSSTVWVGPKRQCGGHDHSCTIIAQLRAVSQPSPLIPR
jgi:hypothetical protein